MAEQRQETLEEIIARLDRQGYVLTCSTKLVADALRELLVLRKKCGL